MIGKCIGANDVQIARETFPSIEECKEKKKHNHHTKQTMHPPNKQLI
jgi:hypothetical protein